MIRIPSEARASLLNLLFVGASACTLRGSADGVAPSRDEPSPAPVPVVKSEPELLAAGTPAAPGFVLYTAEQTIIVPFDGSARTVGEGLWLQDDRVSPPAVTHSLILSEARARTMKLPRCPCLSLAGACEDGRLESRRFASRTGELEQSEQLCTCMRRHQVLGFPPMDVDGETFEACAGGDAEILSSMVAGQLFYPGWDWNGACFGGLSLYDAVATRRELISEPPELSSDGMRSVGCNDQLGPAFVERAWPIDGGVLTRECEDYYESEVFMLRRGELWAARDDISGTHGSRSYLKRPARPDDCPSSNDPCGDPQPFENKAKLDRKRREFWIATDGAAALTAEENAYALWRADADTSVEFELANVHSSTDVIGVRVHADIGPLRAVIGKHATLGLERSERSPTIVKPEGCLALVKPPAPGSTARELGNTCFTYIGIEQWTEAEAICLQGLSIAEEPGTRGAILYNLGLIAEAEGAVEQAGLYYRESLLVRPGNRAVERKLADLQVP